MEKVCGRLDLLFRLKREFIHSTGSVLEHAVNLEGAAHDDSVRGLLLTLSFACGIFGVDGTVVPHLGHVD